MNNWGTLWGTLLSPVYVAGLGIIAGYVLKWWTDKPIREYEREAKRLQFFKAFYELQSLEKPPVSPGFDKRCQQLLRDSSKWMESRPTKGDILAKTLTMSLSLVFTNYLTVYLVAHMPKQSAQLPPNQLYIQTIMHTVAVVSVAFGAFVGFSSGLAPLVLAVIAVFSTMRPFRHLQEAKW